VKDIELIQIAKRKKESREISKQIIDFGVTEDQKIDIMFNIAMTLENHESMRELTSILKKFINSINKEEDDNIIENKSKILT
tara:strand:- start:1272 stop:1517 length:246 start_codon:yes stop_codon:yes gene_type:complete